MECSHRNFQCGNVISLLMFLSLMIFTCTSAFAQELSSPVTLEADEVVFFEIEGRAEARGNVIIPVSYTHLDVYKRQRSVTLSNLYSWEISSWTPL